MLKLVVSLINQSETLFGNILGESYVPAVDKSIREEFDNSEDTIGIFTLSMVLLQYVNYMNQFRSTHITGDGDYWYWTIDGQRTNIRALPPSRYKVGKGSTDSKDSKAGTGGGDRKDGERPDLD